MTVQRYDFSTLSPDAKARLDDDGFLYDSPVVARVGIQEYKNPDGTIRRELRLPEDVFSTDALSSFSGKPITADHPQGRVNSKNAHKLLIGTMMSAGRQDGDYARTDIVIHSPESIGNRRELSLGYTARLDETPGIWNGQKYDAIQRDIRVNHLSVVKVARAGSVARLNLDGNEDFPITQPQEHKTMTTVKVKLDNGIEYDAAPEVSVELSKLRADAAEAVKKLNAAEKTQVEKDILQAKVDGFDAEIAKAKEAGKAEAIERIKLDSVAASLKIDASGKSDKEVKELVIKAFNPKLNLDGKSNVYIDAAFDLACSSGAAENMAKQRSAGTRNDDNSNVVAISSAEKREQMIKKQYSRGE